MPKIEKIDSLGTNKRRLLLENGEKILHGVCRELPPYSSKNKKVVLSFETDDDIVVIHKTIINHPDTPVETVYVSKEELIEKMQSELHITFPNYPFMNMQQIEKSKAVPKMCEASKSFSKIVNELNHCDNEDELYNLQKKISHEVHLFKQSNNVWIQSHWDKSEEEVRAELEAAAEAKEKKASMPIATTNDSNKTNESVTI